MPKKEFIEVLNENNGVIRDWGETKKGEAIIIVDGLEEAKKILSGYEDKFNWVVSHDTYIRCDVCQKIVEIEDTEIDEEGDVICYDCK